MSVEWQHQLRIYLPEEVAKIARTDAKAPALKRLTDVLAAHRATLVNQLDAFEAYVAEAEREGLDKYPLYKWTKATLEDPAKRLKHIKAFAVRVEDREVYSEQEADFLDAALRPLVGGGLIAALSRHDTDPANNLPIPPEHRERTPGNSRLPFDMRRG